MRLAHTRHGLHADEVFGPRPRHETDLGGAPVKLGAELVRFGDAKDAMAKESDAVAEPVRLIEVVPGRLALVEAWLLSEDPDGRADLRIVPAEAKPGDLRGPGARRDERAQQPQGRCFAGAVGSEEAEDLALVHVEIDAVNRGEGAEPLGQFLRADDALHSGSESISRIHR